MAHLETPTGTQDIHNREKESVHTLLPVQMRESSQVFIAFLEDYYEYINQADKPTNLIDRISNEHDVDFTSDRFLDEIKKEIAKGIPESAVLNNRQLFKKIVDYYYTRGSQNSADVFFKLFFDDEITITYPKETLFKTSDATLNSHGFVDSDGSRVEWSNITGDFVKERIGETTGGRKAVFLANESSVSGEDFTRGAYVYNPDNKRWVTTTTGEDEPIQFFVFNTVESRWEFVRQAHSYRWGFDSADVRATNEEGFWSTLGQPGRWSVLNGSTLHSHPDYPVPGQGYTNDIPTTSDIRVNGTTDTTVSNALNSATTRGNSVIAETVLEDTKHEKHFYVHYGELEGDFWEVEHDAILNNDHEGDNIGEHIEINTRHIHSEENLIKYPLSSQATIIENTSNDAGEVFVDDYSIRVHKTSSELFTGDNGQSHRVEIDLGKNVGNHGDFYRLSGTIALLGGGTYSDKNIYNTKNVILDGRSQGWSNLYRGFEQLTRDDYIEIPSSTGQGKRGFNLLDGQGQAGDFEIILERSTAAVDTERTGFDDPTKCTLVFSSLYGSDFKISGLRLERCKDKFLRLGVNSHSNYQIGDLIQGSNGQGYGIETGQIIGLTKLNDDANQLFIDYQPTQIKGFVNGAVNNTHDINIDAMTAGTLHEGMEVYWKGMSNTLDRNTTIIKSITNQNTSSGTATIVLGTFTIGVDSQDIPLGSPSDLDVTIPDNTEINFISKFIINGSGIHPYEFTRSPTPVATAKDNAYWTTSGIYFHKDYNRNLQNNSMWYTANRDRSESQIRAQVYENPGVDPESNQLYARVVQRTNNTDKVLIYDYENLPRPGQYVSYGYKPGGIFNSYNFRYQPGAPTQFMPPGGQTYTNSAVITGKVDGNVSNSTTVNFYRAIGDDTGLGGNQVIRPGMQVTGTGISPNDGTVKVDTVTNEGFTITLTSAQTISNNTILDFKDPVFTSVVKDVSYQIPCFGEVETATTPSATANTFEPTIPLEITSGDFPTVGTVVGGRRIVPGSRITSISNQVTPGSGNKTCDITLTSQAHSYATVKSVLSSTQMRVLWTKGSVPNAATWNNNACMRKNPGGSQFEPNYRVGGTGSHSMNSSAFPKVTAVTKVSNYYNYYDITFDTAQPNLVAEDHIEFAMTGSNREYVAGLSLKFTNVELTLKDKLTIHSDDGFMSFFYRGTRAGGHYYQSEHSLPFVDNRANAASEDTDLINYKTTELLELGTYEANTTIYGKDRDGNISTIRNPQSYPYRTTQPQIPSDTVVFSDKGFVVAPRGKDSYVLPLNMYGKQFITVNASAKTEFFYGYALEDCVIRYYNLEQYREGVRLGDEHRFAEVLRKLGPKAVETEIMLTPHRQPVSYNYGRDAQTYYEVRVSGDYSDYISDGPETIMLRNNQTIPFSEAKRLRVGDIFTPKATNQGAVLLPNGLKVKAAPTEIKHVKAGTKFTFTGNRHHTKLDSAFQESNILNGSHGRYYAHVFDCSGDVVMGQSLEEHNEENTVIAPLSEKILGFKKTQQQGIGPLSLSGKESWYVADHGRSGYNGIPIETIEVKHDYAISENASYPLTIRQPYLVTRNLPADTDENGNKYNTTFSNSTAYQYDAGLLSPEEHAECLVPGIYCEIAHGQVNGISGTSLTLDKIDGTLTAGLELQFEESKLNTALGSPNDAITISSITTSTAQSAVNKEDGTATIVLSQAIDVNDNTRIGFYAKVANTPTRRATGSKTIFRKSNFFDRNVTVADNFNMLLGPHKGGISTNCTNRNLPDQSLIYTTSLVPYANPGFRLTGGFLGSNVRIIIRSEGNNQHHLSGKTGPVRDGQTANYTTQTFPAVYEIRTPLPHEIYSGVATKIGKLKNIGYNSYDVNTDHDDDVLIAKDSRIMYVPAFGLAKLKNSTTNNVLVLKDNALAEDPTGEVFDVGMPQYSSSAEYNETTKSFPPLNYMYAKIKVGMEVSGAGVPANTVVTSVTDQYNVTVNNNITSSANTVITFRAPIGVFIDVGMSVSGTGILPLTKISQVNSGSTTVKVAHDGSVTLDLDTSATLADDTILTFTNSQGKTIVGQVNGATTNSRQVVVDNFEYGNISTTRITSSGDEPPAHIEFVGTGKSVDTDLDTGHYYESIGDGLTHIFRQDTQGNDSFTPLPLEKLKDTYIVPHAIKDWTALTIYDTSWKVYFWDDDGDSNERGWVLYKTVNKPFTRQSVVEIQSEPENTEFGTATGNIVDPNQSSFTPTLWKFEGDKPFYLVLNDQEDDEEVVFGFNRNTYSNKPYTFYADYQNRKGRVSDINKIHDGNFNQEFSYGLNTTLSLDKWETQYRKLVHPSGTKFFGLIKVESEVNRTLANRRNAHLSTGNSTYTLTEGIEWLKNLRLNVGQHSPRFQPGWLDEALTALVTLEPLVNSGVTLPDSVVDIVDQIINATYKFTHTKTNGVSILTLETRNVETETPVSIDTINLPNFPRPVALTSRDIEKSNITSNDGTPHRYAISTIINPNRTGGAPFNIRNLLSNAGDSNVRGLEFEEVDDGHILRIKLLDDGAQANSRQYHLRIYGLQSGALYKVSGEMRVSENTVSGAAKIQIGTDISDGFVQENEAAQNNGTYTQPDPSVGNTSTINGLVYQAVDNGTTTSFQSFSTTGRYWNRIDRSTIGRNNTAGTHDFIDINLRIRSSSGNHSGGVTVEYKNLKIEEYYMENETVFNNIFDSKSLNLPNITGTPAAVTKTFTNFTSWHNPISNLSSNTFFNYQPLNVPFTTNLRAKLNSGSAVTPIANNNTPLNESSFIVGETITGLSSGLTATIISITNITDLQRPKGSNVRLTLGSFSSGNVQNFTFYSTPEQIKGNTSQQLATVREGLSTDTLEVEENFGVRTIDFTFD